LAALSQTCNDGRAIGIVGFANRHFLRTALYFDLFRRDPIIRELNAGEAFFREGEPCNGEMYVLISGTADVVVHGRSVETADPGAILGEMTMIEQAPRAASVIAKTDCRFAVIDHKRFDFLVSQMPGFAREVMRVMARRLRRTDEMLS
jgi:CRP/FNR family cyclic AMP-dependent transcriptional regulator